MRTILLLAVTVSLGCTGSTRAASPSAAHDKPLPRAPQEALKDPTADVPPAPGARPPPCEHQEPLPLCPAGKECTTDPARHCEVCHCKDASKGFAVPWGGG